MSEAEHHTVRALMQREQLDITEPGWVRGTDGQDWVVAPIIAAPADVLVDPLDAARGAVDDVPADADDDTDEVPGCGHPLGCCIPADEDGWSQ